MHPVLIQLGPLTLRTYGLFVALAFVASLQLAKLTFRWSELNQAFLMDLAVVLIFSGLIGARLFYVFLELPYYVHHPAEALKIWEGGLVFYGGFMGAALAGVAFVRHHHMALAAVADAIAPPLALGQAVGRWSCFFAGCCYGKPSTLPWAVHFSDPASLAPLGVNLHPVQIYESLGCLVITLVLLWRLKSQYGFSQDLVSKRSGNRGGDVFWLYLLLYGILRFFMEMLRGDDRGPTLGGLYPSQIISLLAILVAGSVLIVRLASNTEGNHGALS